MTDSVMTPAAASEVPSQAVPTDSQVSGSNEAAAETKKYRVKVDGQELEVDEKTLIRNFQLAKSSDERFKKASEIQKQIAEREAKLKQNPWEVLEELGLNPDELAEQRLLRKLQWEMMPEHERLLAQKDFELSQYKEQLSRQERQRLEHENAQIAAKATAELDAEIADAIQSMGIQKPTPRLVARVAEELLAAYEVRKEKMAAKDAIVKVKSTLHSDIKGILAEVPLDTLVSELLPPEFLKQLREHDLKQYKQTTRVTPVAAKPSSMTQASRETPKGKRLTVDDYFKRFD